MVGSDPTSTGIETAAVIKGMVERERIMECKRQGLVFNGVTNNEMVLKEAARRIGLEILGFVPREEQIAAYDPVGRPTTQLPPDWLGQSAVRQIVEDCILA